MKERKQLIRNILAWLLPLTFGSLGEQIASWDATAPILPLPAVAAVAAARVTIVKVRTTIAVILIVSKYVYKAQRLPFQLFGVDGPALLGRQVYPSNGLSAPMLPRLEVHQIELCVKQIRK